MNVPEHLQVHETPTSFIWVDENGILIAIGKDNVVTKPTPEDQEEQNRQFLEIFGKTRRCMLLELKHAQPSSTQEQKKSAKLLEELTKAMAVIIHNPLGRMIINVFVGLQKPSYPIKIFKPKEEDKAIEWLKQYL